LALDQHQAGTSASGRSSTGSANLESLLGQATAGTSGDLACGFLVVSDGRYYLPGDADGNLVLNVSDAVFLISYIFGSGRPPDPYISGDGDCNHVVNVSDVLVIIAHVFGGQPPPAFCE
jgi:hypothetical protein